MRKPQSASKSTPFPEKPTILVVDDGPMNMFRAYQALNSRCNLLFADSIECTMRTIEKHRGNIDGVLMDALVPEHQTVADIRARLLSDFKQYIQERPDFTQDDLSAVIARLFENKSRLETGLPVTKSGHVISSAIREAELVHPDARPILKLGDAVRPIAPFDDKHYFRTEKTMLNFIKELELDWEICGGDLRNIPKNSSLARGNEWMQRLHEAVDKNKKREIF
jgi:hypothetical protein